MKKIYRSRRERVIGGVCGGIAEHLRVDVSIIRLAWALFSLMGGAGILLYILAWIIIPEEAPVARDAAQQGQPPRSAVPDDARETRPRQTAPPPEAEPEPMDDSKRLRWFGIILIIFGGYFLMERLIPVRISLWPLLLILIGLVLLFSAGTRGNGRSADRAEERGEPVTPPSDAGASRPEGAADTDDEGQDESRPDAGVDREEDGDSERER